MVLGPPTQDHQRTWLLLAHAQADAPDQPLPVSARTSKAVGDSINSNPCNARLLTWRSISSSLTLFSNILIKIEIDGRFKNGVFGPKTGFLKGNSKKRKAM
jgi:hypothetical protein